MTPMTPFRIMDRTEWPAVVALQLIQGKEAKNHDFFPLHSLLPIQRQSIVIRPQFYIYYALHG